MRIQKGACVSGQHDKLPTPGAVNALACDFYCVHAEAQGFYKFYDVRSKRMVWVAGVNAWDYPQWFDTDEPLCQVESEPDLDWGWGVTSTEEGIRRITENVLWIRQYKTNARICVSIGSQIHAVGLVPDEESWFAPVWAGLAPDVRAEIDALSIHYYPQMNDDGTNCTEPSVYFRTSRFVKRMLRVRRWMDSNGAQDKKIWVTETGFVNHKEAYPLLEDDNLRAQLLEYPENLFRALEEANRRFRLKLTRVCWYCAGWYVGSQGDFYVPLAISGELTEFGEKYANINLRAAGGLQHGD